MATPMTASQMVSALEGEGVDVKEFRNWRNHSRNHKGDWGGVNGVIIHHTVTKGTSKTLGIVYDGYSSLPGPLCHAMGAKNGDVYLIGNGRSNHAGSGDGRVLDAVISETSLPSPRRNDTDGNSRFYGIELENMGDGEDPWPRAQYDAAVRWAAAICRFHGWNSGSVIGHKEWQYGKVDPRGFSMDDFRDDVQEILDGKPSGHAPKPKPKPRPSYEPYPGSAWFKRTPRSAVVTAMGKRLVQEGCSSYSDGPGPQWTESDRRSYAKWQRKLGYSGSDADGWPGKSSWDRLKVPNQ